MQITFDLLAHEAVDLPVVAVEVVMAENVAEIPMHQHPSGQIILSLQGAVSCEVQDALWMVPPNCAVWIPGSVLHRCKATLNARVCFLMVKPELSDRLPPQCTTLQITPLLRELMVQLTRMQEPAAQPHRLSMVEVLMGELGRMRPTSFQLPLPDNPKLRLIVDTLMADPSDRSTLADWSARLATSERTLSRLIVAETGLSFGRWRQQMHLLIALRLLASGVTVQATAEQLGYASVTAFITMFKSSLGTTPSRYFAAQGRQD